MSRESAAACRLARGSTVYFAMDEIGLDNVSRLRLIDDKDEVWSEIARIAAGYGFEGVQFTSSLYEGKLGLSLRQIPEIFRRYRLTFHIAGIRPLASDRDEAELEALLQESLEIASENGMEDVSLHPPRLASAGDGDRQSVRATFRRVLKKWMPRYVDQGITLSLESHSGGKFFVFDGLSEFSAFVDEMPGLGVLADLSHLWNDGNGVDDIMLALKDRRVTGLHLSDALARVEVTKGTHLAVGEGEVDFSRILPQYSIDDSVYGVLEVKAESCQIKHSLDMLRRCVGATT